MDKSRLKITELPALSVLSENAFIPFAESKEEDNTYKGTLRNLRESVMFENAFVTTGAGLAATVPNDTFFVYTDDTKEYVNGWVNTASGAVPLLDKTGEQVIYGTYALLRNASKGNGTIFQWIYNGGLSQGGERTFTVPLTGKMEVQEVYVDGLRQFKDVGFELDENDSTKFTLAKPVKANQTVIAICFSNNDIEKINEVFLATYTGPSGASNIGVNGGGTVQEALDSLESGLGALDRASLKQVGDFQTLRNTKPKQEGQVVILTGYYSNEIKGSGVFIGHLTNKADDGGHIASGTGYHWERVANTVNLFDYGIKPCTTSTLVDVTVPMQSAINRAKALNIPLVSDYSFPNLIYSGNFFYITDTIDISGLMTMRGKFIFGLLSANFVGSWKTADNQRGVIKNMNGTYDADGKLAYSTTLGGQDIDTIYVRVWDSNAPSDLQGIVFNTSYSRIGSLGAHRFNNAGVRLASCYDNTIDTIVATRCGSADWYGFTHDSYPYTGVRPDESNANTISQLLSHDCYYRAWCVIGSKTTVVRVHEEGTVVPADMTTLMSSQKNEDKVNTKGYTSSYFYSTGGTISELSIQGAGTSSPLTPVFVGGIDTTTYTTIGAVYAFVAIIDTFWKGNGGTVTTLKADGLAITNNAKISVGKATVTGDFFCDVPDCTIDSLEVTGNITNCSAKVQLARVTGNVTIDQYGKIFSGGCTGNLTLPNSSEVSRFTVDGTFASSAPGPILRNCTFKGAVNITGVGGAKFFDCQFTQAYTIKSTGVPTFYRCVLTGITKVDSSVAGARATFNDCSTTYDLTGGNNAIIKVNGGSSGGFTMNNFTGALLIDTAHVCTSGNSIAGWAVPTVTSVGFGAKTTNPYTGAGWVLQYNGSAAVWTTYRLTA